MTIRKNQRRISVCALLLLVSASTPAFAVDFSNPAYLPANPFRAMAVAPLANRVALPSRALFAPRFEQTPGQTQTPQSSHAQSGTGELTGKGVAFKWMGVLLMGGGGALIARGAVLSDPCKGFPAGVCSSNYTEVRGVSIGLGAGLAVTGAILFAIHNRYRE